MRRMWRTLLLAGIFTVLLGTAALAADNTTESGIYGLTGTGATLNPKTAENGNITPAQKTVNGVTGDFYANAVRLDMTYNSASGNEECLAVVTNKAITAGKVPTASDIVYIDQAAASGNTATFNLYPSSLSSGTTYHVYVSTATGMGLTEVGTFSYYAPYVRGDVNGNGYVEPTDGLLALQIAAFTLTPTETQFLAADVNNNSDVNSMDALIILQAAAFLIEL